MTSQEQQIAIVKLFGWNPPKAGSVLWITSDQKQWADEAHLPNYLNDLNLCHEMEAILTQDQALLYGDILAAECGFGEPHALNFFYVAHATAAQRAEAFLKTIGKWNEDSTNAKP